jgi:hypothetical protein
MAEQGRLRSQGDFPNERAVEYATVLVDLRHRLLPQSLQNPCCEPEDIVPGLYASATGRLTYMILYLDDLALAHAFAAHLETVFQARRYAGQYTLRVEVVTTTQTVTATKMRARSSAAVREVLAADRSPSFNRNSV